MLVSINGPGEILNALWIFFDIRMEGKIYMGFFVNCRSFSFRISIKSITKKNFSSRVPVHFKYITFVGECGM